MPCWRSGRRTGVALIELDHGTHLDGVELELTDIA